MNGARWLRAFLVWLVMMVAESVHGALRMVLLVPAVGDFRARQISVFTGSLIILAIAYLFIRWIRAETTRTLLEVGLAWFLLTVIFEIGLGRFVFGYPWERIMSDYDISQGGLLLIGVVVLAFSPLIAARLRGIGRASL